MTTDVNELRPGSLCSPIFFFALSKQANLEKVYTRRDFLGFVNVSGFIHFRVFGFLGVYPERIFRF